MLPCFHAKPKKHFNAAAAGQVKLNCLHPKPMLGVPPAQRIEKWNRLVAFITPQKGAPSCRSLPTVHPRWVLDGGCTLGADAHDLLLSEQTRSFITHNLESLFYSAWALMLLLGLKIREKIGRSVLWFQAKANRTPLALPPRLPKPYHAHKCASIFFCLFHLLYNETLFSCALRQEAITPKAHFCCLEQSGLFMMWEVYSS